MRQTGGKGGKENALSDVDNAILDIIGRDSPALKGLEIGESGDPTPISASSSSSGNRNSIELNGFGELEDDGRDICLEVSESDDGSSETMTEIKTSRTTKRKRKSGDATDELQVLRKRVFELKAYKLQLECFEYETKLALPRSQFTLDLVMKEY